MGSSEDVDTHPLSFYPFSSRSEAGGETLPFSQPTNPSLVARLGTDTRRRVASLQLNTAMYRVSVLCVRACVHVRAVVV